MTVIILFQAKSSLQSNATFNQLVQPGDAIGTLNLNSIL